MEEQSFGSFSHENVSLTTTENSAIASDGFDFAKYDPYIEKIRALFVPSLEPRIHSCLETFVYRKDPRQLSEYPCLRRCLELANILREPVNAFRTRLDDEGFLLGHAIKYLIKDGLIDCFLNSILLNNRLNKVCRDLDELGIERDLLRYFTVWNYINERDYWLENDQRISMPMPEQSYDSIDRHSDLDVEIGSEFRNNRNGESSKRSLKRRAMEDSSEDAQKNDDFSENFDENNESRRQLESWLSGNLSIREKSKLRHEKRKKSISQNFPCGTSDRSICRIKNSRQSGWDGKFLRLKISDVCSASSRYEPTRSFESSKLRLPCNFEDLMLKIMNFETSSTLLRSISRRKKFQASLINICHRVNVILGKIDKNEIKRCRLNCEIFPGHLSFRLTQREPNGCKICLLTERIVLNRIEASSRSASCVSSVGQLPRIMETENSRETGLTIYESARMNPDDESLKIAPSFDGKVPACLELSNEDLKSKNMSATKELSLEDDSLSPSNENSIENQACRCDASSNHALDDFGHKRQTNRAYNHRVTDFQSKRDANSSKESAREESLIASNRYTFDQKCICDVSLDDGPSNFANQTENSRATDRMPETKMEQRTVEELEGKESLVASTPNDFASRPCFCDDSFDIPGTENNSKALTTEESLIHSADDKFDNELGRCGTSFESPPDLSEHEAKTTINRDGHRSDHRDPNASVSFRDIRIASGPKIDAPSNMTLKHTPANISEASKTQSDLTCSKSVSNAPDDIRKISEEILSRHVLCECPSDCSCVNKEITVEQPANCDSQCSCDSCHDPGRAKSLKPWIDESSVRKITVESPTKKSRALIANRTKPHCSETRANNKVLKNNESRKVSLVPLKSIFTKVLSSPFEERTIRTTLPDPSERKIVKRSRTNVSKDESFDKSPRIISARLPTSKGQRINISIELCPDSKSSMEKILKNVSKAKPALHDSAKKMANSTALPSLVKSRCRSVDRGNSAIRVNGLIEKNIKDEFHVVTNGRVYSPPRPLESRDYLPPSAHTASMRNPCVYRDPIKSVTRSSRKFARRSMSQGKRSPKNCETTREFYGSRGNKRCWEKINHRQAPFVRNDESSRSSGYPERFSSSIINSHLCHAFSSSSVDRMRHLIKTKLRRILLERDKSTNTPKMTLTNKKYRVSVPNGKTERSQISRKCCRTIWESHSATDSTCCTSRSYVTKEDTGIRDREAVDQLWYNTATDSRVSAPKYAGISRISDTKNSIGSIVTRRNLTSDAVDESSDLESMKNFPRLAGGSDFVPRENSLGYERNFNSKMPIPRLSSATRKDKCSTDLGDQKLSAKGMSCNFYEIMKNKTDSLSNDDETKIEISRNKLPRESVDFSDQLNSTSRHIYLYEFGQFESSNDELSWCNDRRDRASLKNPCTPKIRQDRENEKSSRTKRKECETKNAHVSRSGQTSFAQKRDNVSRIVDEAKNSSPNADTMNSRVMGFGHLDDDLRSKLTQYVSLCKSVKYSLLRRLRPEDVYKFGNS